MAFKFKVGDRVIRIAEDDLTSLKVGEEYTVIKTRLLYDQIAVNGGTGHYYVEGFELSKRHNHIKEKN